MKRKAVFEETFSHRLSLDGAMEHLVDNLPLDWGDTEEIVDLKIDQIAEIYEGSIKLKNKGWLELELFYNQDKAEWIGKAYEKVNK